jgi:hydroxymethylpyrimidine pyrophosphatase-like HAD family hydrolase
MIIHQGRENLPVQEENVNSKKFCLAIDFDGTIIEDNFPDTPKLKKGAKEIINYFKDLGCNICIWTCRDLWFVKEVESFLEESGIKYDSINTGSEDYIHSRKIFADVYVDDKSMIDFTWEKATEIISHFYEKWKIKKVKTKKEMKSILKKRLSSKDFFGAEVSLDLMLSKKILGFGNEIGK